MHVHRIYFAPPSSLRLRSLLHTYEHMLSAALQLILLTLTSNVPQPGWPVATRTLAPTPPSTYSAKSHHRRQPPLRRDGQCSDPFQSCLTDDTEWKEWPLHTHSSPAVVFPSALCDKLNISVRQALDKKMSYYVCNPASLKTKQGGLHCVCVCQFYLLLKWNMQSSFRFPVSWCEQSHVVCQSMTGYLKEFCRIISLSKFSLLFFCAGASPCRSQMPFKRATLHRRCGVSSVWAMPSCSVPSSSSWGACFSWPLPCFSWMTGRRLKNSKWLRQCLNNSPLFKSLLSHLLFKESRPARNVLRWVKILRTPPQRLKT